MASTSTGMTRMQSFPFDSKADGYDADGYPVYDRAVGASMLRSTFGKFFSNGVFPSPGDALQIGKGASGLTVTIQPGIAIINGAMGGVDGEDPLTLTLDTEAPQGNVEYAIMLRYDNTDERRSLYFNVVRGEASATPVPPEPDTTTPEVHEMRLGYVTVPSNATDLSEATVTNEKGLEVCPFAAPFEEIDVSTVIADAQASAQEYLQQFNAFLAENWQFVEDAIDGSTAGNLQNQINELKETSGVSQDAVDNVTIGYGEVPTAIGVDKLYVKDGGITADKLADGSVGTSAIADGSIVAEHINDLADIRGQMGLGNTLGVLPVSCGGTGVSSASGIASLISGAVVGVSSVDMNGTDESMRITASPPEGYSLDMFSGAFVYADYRVGEHGARNGMMLLIPYLKLEEKGGLAYSDVWGVYKGYNTNKNVLFGELMSIIIDLSQGNLVIDTNSGSLGTGSSTDVKGNSLVMFIE